VQRLLSVLLPVKDAQSTLEASVHEILDVATDFGQRFELLIIDDGSTDATGEVAHELTHCYPQVRVVYHGGSLGREAAIRTGLRRCRGEVVMLRDDDSTLRVIERRSEDRGKGDGHLLPERPDQPAVGARRFTHKEPVSFSKPAAPNYLNRPRDLVLAD
jgi:glycosyltransferase involved in cell wall biosynthesis